MSINDVRVIELTDASRIAAPGRRQSNRWRAIGDRVSNPSLFMRYVFVSGLFGVPASIGQLTLLRLAYGHYVGAPGLLMLNALWIINFEIGLVRNYALHCLYTWRVPPSRKSLSHAHVAATGAIVIDLAAFNLIVWSTGIIPLAQVIGASAGFGLNFVYNKFLTFARSQPIIEEVTTQ